MMRGLKYPKGLIFACAIYVASRIDVGIEIAIWINLRKRATGRITY